MEFCDYKMNTDHERCVERAGFSFWSDTNDGDKHFFKIMAAGFRERLTIPHNFVQNFLGKLPRTVELESRNGSTFNVQLIDEMGKLVLVGPGWEEFVTVHDLNIGDFLVFKYDGSSHLKVLIFDPSCCEKPSSVVMTRAIHKSQRSEPAGMESQNNDLARKFSSNERKRSIHIGSPSSSHDPSEDTALSEDDQRAHFNPTYILACGTNLNSTMKKKLKEKVRAIHSEIPVYVCVIKKSNIYGTARCMNISRGYADIHLPFEKQVLLLQCNGKNWKVRCVRVDKRVRLWKGWKGFAADNNLQLGEICLFEILKDKQYTMNVHIIRRS